MPAFFIHTDFDKEAAPVAGAVVEGGTTDISSALGEVRAVVYYPA